MLAAMVFREKGILVKEIIVLLVFWVKNITFIEGKLYSFRKIRIFWRKIVTFKERFVLLTKKIWLFKKKWDFLKIIFYLFRFFFPKKTSETSKFHKKLKTRSFNLRVEQTEKANCQVFRGLLSKVLFSRFLAGNCCFPGLWPHWYWYHKLSIKC